MAIQVRRGNEADFDASKMLPGEWAVSLDTRYVRMCFAPGIVLRMATYDSFEADMSQIKSILAECKSIQSAVQRIQSEVNSKASLTIEYANSAKQSADRAYSEAERAKTYANNAEAVTGVQIATKDRAGLIKGGDNHIAEDGTLMIITETTETTMPNSHEGRLLVNEIGGVCEQESTTGSQLCKSVTEQSDTLYEAACFIDCDLQPSTTYTLSFKGVSGNTYYTSESLFTENVWITLSNDVCSVTLTTKSELNASAYESGKGWIFLKNGKTQTTASKFEQVMLNLGTTALPYEPYTGGSPALKKSVVSGVKTHGLNFLDMRNAKGGTNAGITVTMNADGSYSYVGTATNAEINVWLIGNWTGTPVLFTIPAGKYFMQGVNLYNNGKPVFTGGREGSIIVLSEDTPVTGVRAVGAVAGTTYNETHYPIIARSDGRVYQWEPYKESSFNFSNPIDLYGIGDVQDVIEDGKVKRRFAKLVFTGNETWNLFGTPGGKQFRIYLNKIALNKSNAVIPNVLCNIAKAESPDNMWNKSGDFISVNHNLLMLSVPTWEDVTDASTLKAKLKSLYDAGTPAYAVYEVEELTTEELPTADQIALNSLETYDGITYLEFIVTEEVQPTFRGEYGTSKVGGMTLESLLTARNNDLQLSSLEAIVVNNI